MSTSPRFVGRAAAALVVTLALAALALAAWAAPARAQQACEDQAELVSVELDPAAGTVAPGAELTVTWLVENTGSCTWTASYRLVVVRDGGLEGARSFRLRRSVPPGATHEITVDLTAPQEPGRHEGTWRLEGADGAYFGPPLEVAVSVTGEQASALGTPALPAILSFGGRGGGGAEDPCLDDGGTVTRPSILIAGAEPGYTAVLLCAWPAQSEVAVTLRDPDDKSFRRTYTVGDPVEVSDYEGNTYPQTWVTIELGWHPGTAAGAWRFEASDGHTRRSVRLEVDPEAGPDGPKVTNQPPGDIEPFDGQTCLDAYSPGSLAYKAGGEVDLSGSGFSPRSSLHVGFYAERRGLLYMAQEAAVEASDDGTFASVLVAPEEPGRYWIYTVEKLDPAGFGDFGLDPSVYNLDGSYDESVTAVDCLRVADDSDQPLALSFLEGTDDTAYIAIENLHDYDDDYVWVPNDEGPECSYGMPSWLPGGEWVLFEARCGNSADLYMDASGQDAKRLTDTPEIDESEPSASPDGRIAFRRTPAGEAGGELALLDPETGEERALGVQGSVPRWSPDGRLLAYMSDEGGAWQIYVLDPESGDVSLISAGCDTNCRFPAWSPDGSAIVYSKSTSPRSLTSGGLWIAPLDGGRPQEWLAGAYDHPTWSAAGWIAFDGPEGIYRARAGDESPAVELYLFHGSDPISPYSAPVYSR